MKSNYLVLAGILLLSGIGVGGCGPADVDPTAVPTTSPTIERTIAPTSIPAEALEGVHQAREATIRYLTSLYGEGTPSPNLDWIEEGTSQEGLVGFSSFRYRADDWVMDISYPVVGPKDVIYEVMLSNGSTGFWWQGKVDAAGDVITSPEEPTSEREGEPVDGWTGSIEKLPPGNQFGQRFVRDNGEPYGIGTTDESAKEQIEEAMWTGARIRVWGRWYSGVPASQARQIEANRIEILSEAAPEARYMSPFAEVSVSSQLPSDRYGTYGPFGAIDGLKETAWVEGVSGPGIGEWIELTFPGTIELHAMGFDVGFDKDADLFAKNNRIKRATVIFSNGERVEIDFEDTRGLQEFAMVRAPGPNLETTSVKVIIKEIYSGSDYDDTCLAEIEIWGIAK